MKKTNQETKQKTKANDGWNQTKQQRYVSLDDNNDDDECRMSMMIIHSN